MSVNESAPPRIFDSAYYRRLAGAERTNPWAAAMRRVGVEMLRRELAGRRAQTILDAGCGAGYFVRECARELGIAYAVCAVAVNHAAGRGAGDTIHAQLERHAGLGMQRVAALLDALVPDLLSAN